MSLNELKKWSILKVLSFVFWETAKWVDSAKYTIQSNLINQPERRFSNNLNKNSLWASSRALYLCEGWQ